MSEINYVLAEDMAGFVENLKEKDIFIEDNAEILREVFLLLMDEALFAPMSEYETGYQRGMRKAAQIVSSLQLGGIPNLALNNSSRRGPNGNNKV